MAAPTIPNLSDVATGLAALLIVASLIGLVTIISDRLIGPPDDPRKPRSRSDWAAGFVVTLFLSIGPVWLVYYLSGGHSCK